MTEKIGFVMVVFFSKFTVTKKYIKVLKEKSEHIEQIFTKISRKPINRFLLKILIDSQYETFYRLLPQNNCCKSF